MKHKKVICLFGLAALFALSMSSFRLQEQETGKPNRRLPKELKEYLKKEVFPAILQKRTEFETQLSTDEKSEIATMRTKAKLFRENQHQNRRVFDEIMESGQKVTDEQKIAFADAHISRKAFHEEMKKSLEKYGLRLEPVFEELSPKIEVWKNDIHEIMKNFRDETVEHDGRNGNRGGEFHFHKGKGLGKMLSPAHFLLLDPVNPRFADKGESISSLIYPNPSKGDIKIKFELEKKADVSIDIIDRQGNLVKSVLKQELESGKQEVEFNTEGFKSGIYFYILQMEGKTDRKRFVVE